MHLPPAASLQQVLSLSRPCKYGCYCYGWLLARRPVCLPANRELCRSLVGGGDGVCSIYSSSLGRRGPAHHRTTTVTPGTAWPTVRHAHGTHTRPIRRRLLDSSPSFRQACLLIRVRACVRACQGASCGCYGRRRRLSIRKSRFLTSCARTYLISHRRIGR